MNVVIGVNFVPKFLNMKCGLISLLTFISSLVSMTVFSQVTRKKTILFQYGIADAFVYVLSTGEYPVGQLKREGDFGLGAPDLVDGELTMSNGVVYQTKATGRTIVAPVSLRSSLAFVCFFRPDTSFIISGASGQKDVLERLTEYLQNKNGMYAIRISGLFHHVRARAFPAVTGDSFPPLSSILDRQHFFDYEQVHGVLIGYRMPAWLGGINIAGFHFHFLSDDLKKGGHALDFLAEDIRVEVALLDDINVEAPRGRAFEEFNFKGENSPALNKVEKGK